MESKKVLVVDDDDGYRAVLSSHLRKRGFDVDTASDGQEALDRLIGGERFAVLVTDMMMPRLRGDQLAREAREIDPWMQAIMVTASGSLENAIAAMREYGTFDYLLKPLEQINELSLAVDRAFSHRELLLNHERLKKQVKAEANRLRALVQNTEDAILACNSQDIVTVANPSAVRLLRKGDLVGRQASIVLPKELSVLLFNWRTEGNQEPAMVELAWPRDSMHLVQISPIRGEDTQSVHGWIMVLHDITHQKKFNEYKVGLLTHALDEIHEPLSESFYLLRELNQQLIDDPNSKQMIYGLGNNLSKIQKWMDDIITLGRIDAGVDSQPHAIYLANLIREVYASLDEKLKRQNHINLSLNIGAAPPVFGDEILISRLVSEMITYISQKMNGGGDLELAIYHNQNQVWMRLMEQNHVHNSYSSNGDVNIIPDDKDFPDKDMSLILIKAIAKQMGGQVWVRKDHKTSLSISLPRSDMANLTGSLVSYWDQ